MFKWIVAAALIASISVCALVDFSSRKKAGERRHHIAELQAEVKPLQPIADEVTAYQRKKDALQRRIDVINQLKQNQKDPASAIAKVHVIDPAAIDSIAVTDANELVINRR